MKVKIADASIKALVCSKGNGERGKMARDIKKPLAVAATSGFKEERKI